MLGIEDINSFKKSSFSQTGEDIIVDYIFRSRNIQTPSYIDIGAYHPFLFSNTASFYKKGSKGINIEPNPDGIGKFYKHRPADQNLNIGISNQQGTLDYFCMNIATMNTFDEAGANELVKITDFRLLRKKQSRLSCCSRLLQGMPVIISPISCR